MLKPSKYEWDEWVSSAGEAGQNHADDESMLTGPETMEVLATALPPVTPSDHVRSRLMASLGQRSRFEWLADTVATMLDVARDKALAYLENIDVPSQWQASPFSGVSLIHVEGGSAVGAAITGFVRIEPGFVFPEHSHLGDESVLVVQGTIVLSGDRTARPGDVLMADNTIEHEVAQGNGPPLIYLAVVRKGIVIDGQVFSPDHPDM
ncbi:MAG: cupin domain-containing protein [Myxococcales bacterium]|nr:cupin domain-containing protein [Myxococcales bacterium]